MATPVLQLNDDCAIPQVALGLWKVTDQTEFDTMFDAAIEAGYRHFDSAQIYRNEQLLGAAIKRHQLPREELFITTKIDVRNFTPGRVRKSFAESLEKLQTDYVDLLLLHFPVPLLRSRAWQELEKIQQVGQAKSIGVSNYAVRHLQQLQKTGNVTPAVNQVELHVFLQQPELLEYCLRAGIAVEAYSPLAHGQVIDNPVIAAIAKKHDASYAQIMLRWCLQQGVIILPKSKTPSRLQENLKVLDFTLDADDMQKLQQLDRNLRTCWSPVHIP